VREVLFSEKWHTLVIVSIGSPRFTFRIRCASSIVIRCSRVRWSVADPDVAVPTPAASTAACGEYFASSKTES